MMEEEEKNEYVKMRHSSVNGFFIFTTISLLLVLIAFVTLTVNPQLRLELR